MHSATTNHKQVLLPTDTIPEILIELSDEWLPMATSNRALTAIGDADESLSAVIRRYANTRWGMFALLFPALAVILGLMMIPTLLLLSYSVKPFVGGEIMAGFTLAHYRMIFSSNLHQTIILRTLRIAAVVTILDFALGFPLAYAAVRKGGLMGKTIVIATLAPLTIDLVVRSFGWFILLSGNGIVNGLLGTLGLINPQNPPKLLFNEIGIIIGLTHVMLPFMVFPIINVLHTIPRSYEEAARNLGANRLTVFRTVIFPLALPGISAGVLITFIVSMAAYVTPTILGGGVKVVPVVITNAFTSTGNWPFASALSMLLVVLALVVILGYNRILQTIDQTGGI